MSKLYKEYMSLKMKNSQKIYLFKSGLFYIFLDEDAKIMSKELGLRLTNLNSNIQKCGFPKNSFAKYFNMIENLEYTVEIILPENVSELTVNLSTYIEKTEAYDFIIDFLNLKIDNLSISEAFEKLSLLQKYLKDFIKP